MSICEPPSCIITSHLWGGNDAQQVAYAVTLLRDSAHEWYTVYEKRNRQMPRDWTQLSTALLERFGSNIRSQEA